jgi:hypothetical protein
MARHWRGHLPAAPQLPLQRGVYTGKRIGPPVTEREHFFACPVCAEPVDMRDLAIVFAHEGPMPHPKAKAPPGWKRPTAEIVKFPKT